MAERSPKKIYLSILVTLLLLIFFHYLGWLNWLERSARQLMSAILIKTHYLSVAIDKSNDVLGDRKECQAEYEQIIFWQKQNEISVARFKVLEKENEEFKKLLSFSQRTGYRVLTASVVGRSSENAERILAVSVGFNKGVKIGQAVVVLDGIIVGKIVKVEQDMSWMRLINDGNSKIAAAILNNESSQGVVEGGYGLSVNMNFIPRNEKVTVGETVITAGLDADVPKGLLIGTVAAIVNEAYQPFQKAVLNPAVDLTKLTNIGILINGDL